MQHPTEITELKLLKYALRRVPASFRKCPGLLSRPK